MMLIITGTKHQRKTTLLCSTMLSIQGFAYGSGMGTNHLNGYQVRKIYTTAWLMRDAIYKHPHRDAYLSTLRFWAARKKPVSHVLQRVTNCWIPGIRY